MVQPTAEEQLFLELVNRARSNPQGEAALYDIDLNAGLAPGTISDEAKQPLAWNFDLIEAARNHNQWMLNNNIFSHTGEGGSNAGDRIVAAGYELTGIWAWGENLAWRVISNSDDLAPTIGLQHRGLFESPSHRANLMNDVYREAGIGVSSGAFQGWDNVSVATHNFAKSGDDLFLTGVAFSDSVIDDDFYTIGEGLAGITVIAVRISDQQSFITTTMEAGGYQIALEPGTYQIAFSGAPLPQNFTQTVAIGTQNAKLDLDLNDLIGSGVLSDSSSNNNQSLTASTTMSNFDFRIGDIYDNFLYGGDDTQFIYGLGGNDTLSGGDGDDILVGGTGNDELWGGYLNDILIGVDLNGTIPGAAEIDQLTGGYGSDTFVLGDTDIAYYSVLEDNDYAVIRDFNLGQGDTIQLKGSAAEYKTLGSDVGTQILSGETELIAIIEGVQFTDADLNSSAFVFV